MIKLFDTAGVGAGILSRKGHSYSYRGGSEQYE